MALSREQWGSRLAVIAAVAGSAIGLGNLLRFPAKVVANGGGAFMIPYFVSFLLLGLPLMWIEWTIGRYGGGFGHGTAPGIFHSLARKNRFVKYFGVIGIFGPLVIFIYYTYIESWTLAYSFFALCGKYAALGDHASMQAFLRGYQGLESNGHFDGIGWAYLFFVVTFACNIGVIYYGIRGGIGRLCRFAFPLLFIFGFILVGRVFTLGAPSAGHPEWHVLNGLGFMWNPDFAALKSAKVWLEAAGQIFFTLSVGIGVILTYASYLSKSDDVVLSGLTASGANELAEVILGGSLVIPAAFVFFGPVEMKSVAQSGTFNLGFVTMPLVLNQVPYGALTGFLWFMLLFLAGITSSVSLAQPAIAFMEDEFDIGRGKAVGIFGAVSFVLCQPCIFLLGKGIVDEMDFWGGTFFLVVFATIEVVLFAWVFGMEKAWDEIHHGADMALPRFYKWIIKYVTPLFLFFILGTWVWQEWRPIIAMEKVTAECRPYVFTTRLALVGLFGVLAVLVKLAWRRRRLSGKEAA